MCWAKCSSWLIIYNSEKMDNKNEGMLRVTTTRAQTKDNYDRISRVYDYFEGVFEIRSKNICLSHLDIKGDEIFLEIGFGTGFSLNKVARIAGTPGKVYGIDLSTGMREVTEKRLKRSGLLERVSLYCGDAMKMPYKSDFFDAVFISFTLELFDNPDIPLLLEEIKRVMKKNGRLGIVSLSEEDSDGLVVKLYKWAHKRFPVVVDCRPIYLEQILQDAGFRIIFKRKLKIMGLPVEAVTANV